MTAEALIALLLLTGGCLDEAVGTGPADASLDASMPDAAPGPNADAEAPGPVSQEAYDFCDRPWFRLPIARGTYSDGVRIWGRRLVYNKADADDLGAWDVYLLDLDACVEYRLTRGARAHSPVIHGNVVSWVDFQPPTHGAPEHCSDLYLFDLGTWTTRRLTDDPQCEDGPETNGAQLLFTKNNAAEYHQGQANPAQLILHDLVSETATALLDVEMFSCSTAIGATIAAWRCDSAIPVIYRLETGEMWGIPLQLQQAAFAVHVWDRYLTYFYSDPYDVYGDHLVLHDTESGEATMLHGHDVNVWSGPMHDHLVLLHSTLYSDPRAYVPADLEIFDPRSGLFRRLTSTSGTLGAEDFFSPLLVVGDATSLTREISYYVVDLASAGVLDPAGHLIDGPPVLDPFPE